MTSQSTFGKETIEKSDVENVKINDKSRKLRKSTFENIYQQYKN